MELVTVAPTVCYGNGLNKTTFLCQIDLLWKGYIHPTVHVHGSGRNENWIIDLLQQVAMLVIGLSINQELFIQQKYSILDVKCIWP